MRLRVSLLAVVIGLLVFGVWRIEPLIASGVQTGRVVSSLRNLRLPGVSGCGTQALVNPAGMLCGQGPAAPENTAVTLRERLRSLGATDVAATCVTVKVIGVACRVTGLLHGKKLLASLTAKSQGTSGAPPSGVFLAGGIGPLAASVPDFLRHGTPLPLPSETLNG